ncbi:MAG: isopenicillin N synthase family oxygenase, partial [Actinobacteria bacterium]|nr:isopenicillin N synthase family oxygenase [Actinomycetota bacterium]
MESIPIIDLAEPDDAKVAAQIDAACRAHGFFVVINHGVEQALLEQLDAVSREFFALADDEKARISMERGGIAWRGWFPLGGELTSGVADHKEGIYFGTELPAGDRRPMHGPNLFPERPAAMRAVVLA